MSTHVRAPQLIQPSVAIETGLVFLGALQLEREEKRKQFKVFMGVPSSVCMQVCESVHTRIVTALFIHPFHFEVRKKIKAELVVSA